MAETEVTHVVVRLSNSQAALFAASMSAPQFGSDAIEARAARFLRWLEEAQADG